MLLLIKLIKFIFVNSVAVIGLREILSTVTEGGGVSARVGISVLQGELSEPVIVRVWTANVNALGKCCIVMRDTKSSIILLGTTVSQLMNG